MLIFIFLLHTICRFDAFDCLHPCFQCLGGPSDSKGNFSLPNSRFSSAVVFVLPAGKAGIVAGDYKTRCFRPLHLCPPLLVVFSPPSLHLPPTPPSAACWLSSILHPSCCCLPHLAHHGVRDREHLCYYDSRRDWRCAVRFRHCLHVCHVSLTARPRAIPPPTPLQLSHVSGVLLTTAFSVSLQSRHSAVQVFLQPNRSRRRWLLRWPHLFHPGWYLGCHAWWLVRWCSHLRYRD